MNISQCALKLQFIIIRQSDYATTPCFIEVHALSSKISLSIIDKHTPEKIQRVLSAYGIR